MEQSNVAMEKLRRTTSRAGALKSATNCGLYDSPTRRKLLIPIYFTNPNFRIQLLSIFVDNMIYK